jgi:hypothetical protein
VTRVGSSRDSTDNSQTTTTGAANSPIAKADASYHEGNIKLQPWLLFLAWSSGVAFAMSLFTAIVCYVYTREAKQVEIQLMYTNAILLREGMVRPGDVVYGPEGNLEYDGHKLIKPKEK